MRIEEIKQKESLKQFEETKRIEEIKRKVRLEENKVRFDKTNKKVEQPIKENEVRSGESGKNGRRNEGKESRRRCSDNEKGADEDKKTNTLGVLFVPTLNEFRGKNFDRDNPKIYK